MHNIVETPLVSALHPCEAGANRQLLIKYYETSALINTVILTKY
jgi:hypothetical protein